MTQHHVSDPAEPVTTAAHVPLSERPLVADSENTVISAPDQPRSDAKTEPSANTDAFRQRLFPASGTPTGEEAGIRLAHFEISQRLGAGGMGAVFRAADLELARDVALKILHPASSQDTSLIARFRNEARACASLNHDNIARVFYAGSQDGLYFIAYEFASGRTIRDLIMERGRLTAADTVNYAIQVTLALNHIAAAGIVHRDIKPSNIMLTESGRVKVVDLGLARRDTTDSIGDITVAGTTLGTFDYIAPEQARDPRNADIRSDIYSLGCTMYHMLTGQPPYPEGTALQKLLDHQGKSPPDPRTINGAVPPELAAIMRKMMANSPGYRYQAPGLLLTDLIQMASLLGLHSVPAEGIVWKKLSPVSGRQPLGAVWVFVSVLLICLTALILQRSPRSDELPHELSRSEESEWNEVDPADYRTATDLVAVTGTEERIASAPSSSVASSTSSDSAAATDSGTGSQDGTLNPPANANDAALAAASARNTYRMLPNSGPITPLLLQLSLSPAQPMAPASAATRTEQIGPFVLQTSTGAIQSYRTLKAAVADSRSGDVVLLRYNGFPDDLPAQPPVRIVGMNLIIRAADGFRPTLEFDGVSEGAVSPGQMFSLRSNGSLTMRDVDLRLIARDELVADRWSLFHCVGPNRIHLENVSIESCNPDDQPAVLFDLTDESASPVETSREETEITLTRVICRGDTNGFRIATQPRGRIRLQNCGIALKGSLMDIRGDNSMLPARGSLEVFLDHVTCIHTAPLMHLNDSDERKGGGTPPVLPKLSVRSEASVFACSGADRRFLYSEGSSYVEDIEAMVSWNGFTNLYDGYSVFWQIETSALDYSSRRLDFQQWKQFWQTRSDSEDTSGELLPQLAWRNPSWRTPGTTMAVPTITPSAFELDAALFIPGLQSLPRARDGLVPGVNAQELPPFPRTVPSASSGASTPAAAIDSGAAPATHRAALIIGDPASRLDTITRP